LGLHCTALASAFAAAAFAALAAAGAFAALAALAAASTSPTARAAALAEAAASALSATAVLLALAALGVERRHRVPVDGFEPVAGHGAALVVGEAVDALVCADAPSFPARRRVWAPLVALRAVLAWRKACDTVVGDVGCDLKVGRDLRPPRVGSPGGVDGDAVVGRR